MNSENMKKLLKQLNGRIDDIEKQKSAFHALTQEIESLERLSKNDDTARERLLAFQQYQQSERFTTLREKAMKEITILQQQYSHLQTSSQQAKIPAAEPDSAMQAEKSTTRVVKPKKRLYI